MLTFLQANITLNHCFTKLINYNLNITNGFSNFTKEEEDMRKQKEKKMKKIILLLLFSTVMLSIFAGGAAEKETSDETNKVKTITYTVRHDSSNENVVSRMNMIIDGFKQLEKEDPKVHFEFNYLPKLEVNELAMQFHAGVEADFFFDEETATGSLVKGGIIQPVDWFATLPNVKDTLIPNVRELSIYDGHMYGVPIDMALGCLYANKKILSKLGWSSEEIETWPKRVQNGEWTFEDMAKTCKKAIDMGLVKYGFMLDGVDNAGTFGIAKSLGIEMYDREQNKLIFDRNSWLEFYKFWEEAVHEDMMIPKSLPNFEGTYNSFFKGDTLFFSDVSGYEYWRRNFDGDAEKEFPEYYEENFTQALIPSYRKGEPAQCAMKLRSMFVFSSVKGEKLDYLKKALNLSYLPENQVNNMLTMGKLSTIATTYDLQEIKDFKFASDTAYMTDYATIRSGHPDYNTKYSKYYRNQIEGVIVDNLSAIEAVDKLESELRFNIDADQIIFK